MAVLDGAASVQGQGEVVDLREPAAPRWPLGRVGIVGLGYVGLPTAVAFADAGVATLGVDISTDRLDRIRARDVDLIATDLMRLERILDDDPSRFELTDDPTELSACDAVVICVPTPVDEHQVPDMRALERACMTVVAAASPGQVIVLTSTTFVGSTEEFLGRPLEKSGLEPGRDVSVAFSPERIDPGNSINTQETTPRVVGGVTSTCAERAARLLGSVAPVVHVVSSPEVAEFTKLYENSFRAVNIAFANEMAEAANQLDLDVIEIIEAAKTKPYGFMAFYPGPGVGGHCIPCDPHYLLWQLRARRHSTPILNSAMESIASRPGIVVDQVRAALAATGKPIRGSRVVIAGVAYKPDVADARESPAVVIMSKLVDEGAVVSFVDPYVDAVTLASGQRVHRSATVGHHDLAVVHTLHRTDYSWLAGSPAVLDATYRASAVVGASPHSVDPVAEVS